MASKRTQKQTHILRNFRPRSGNSARFILRKPRPIRKSGILFAGIAATAGISTLAFALQHDSKSLHQSVTADIKTSATSGSPSSVNDESITINSSQAPSPEEEPPSTTATTSDTGITGQATINNEVIPLSGGTVQRSYTDDNGTQHSVTITVDGQSTSTSSTNTDTDIHIYSSSNSNTDSNTTRGSPRR